MNRKSRDLSHSNSRRKFLMKSGAGLMAVTALHPFFQSPQRFRSAFDGSTLVETDSVPVKLKPLDAPSEAGKPEPYSPLEPIKRIGFAIVGLGHLSLGNILPAMGKSKFAKATALVSGNANKARAVADQYGISEKSIYNYQNFDDIRNNEQVDVVYVVLPNSMHAEYTIRAAKAGKHVLCEKPMATTVREARDMIGACEKAGKKLMIAYRIQYEPHNALMQEWVRKNKFGRTKIIEMFNGQNIGDSSQWRLKKNLSGGGSLPDIGIYCLNTARWLTGEEPEWVMASTYSSPGDERFREVEESVMFQMKFPSGTLVNAATSYGVHECRRYRCLADNGAWFGLDPAFPYTGLKIEMNEVRSDQGWAQFPNINQEDQFALEMDHFAQCIMYDKKPYTPGEEGLQDHLIMDAIYQSAAAQKPVSLRQANEKGLDPFRGDRPKAMVEA